MPEEFQTRACAMHPAEMTRLSCTECETPICPKCMVPYEAGFKCPVCVKSRPSHIVQLGGRHKLLAPVLGLAAGYVYGAWLHPVLMSFGFFRILGIPVLGLILAYAVGKLAGNLIQRPLQYKRGGTVLILISVSGMLGLLLSPFSAELMRLLAYLSYTLSVDPTRVGTSAAFALVQPVAGLAAGGLFLKGLRAPFGG